MKTTFFIALTAAALAATALADDQVRNVQTALKSLGFYYGDVNGQSTAETTSAIRRYQIRYGLEVTGTLTPETVNALGIGARNPASSAPAPTANDPAAAAPAARANPPLNLRRDQSAEESDRAFLRREAKKDGAPEPRPSSEPPVASVPPAPARPTPAPQDEGVVPPPAPLQAPSPDFPVLYAGTPYASAPFSVQQDTLRRAQSILGDRGYYRDIVDGLPGPATEEALLTFQRSARLTLTGRLDMDTLRELRLLPREPGVQFGFEFRMPHRVFRGYWGDR